MNKKAVILPPRRQSDPSDSHPEIVRPRVHLLGAQKQVNSNVMISPIHEKAAQPSKIEKSASSPQSLRVSLSLNNSIKLKDLPDPAKPAKSGRRQKRTYAKSADPDNYDVSIINQLQLMEQQSPLNEV